MARSIRKLHDRLRPVAPDDPTKRHWFWQHPTVRTAKKIVVFVIGSSVVLLGIVMLVTPGPAVVVIPAGLAFLGIEFAWARRLLKRSKRWATDAARSVMDSSGPAGGKGDDDSLTGNPPGP